jgi:quercetin 2,3-dioxygenase
MTHPHQDREIVTWGLEGELEHKDSEGNKGIIYPGLAQRMSAGTGIWHSEMNPSGNKSVHFVQMWVLPDTERIKPSYEHHEVGHELDKGQLIPIASGKGHDAAISIRQKDAVLWVGRLQPGQSVTIPDALYVHLFVAKGAVRFEGSEVLQAGDTVRLTMAGTPSITADANLGAEVLIWESNQKIKTS